MILRSMYHVTRQMNVLQKKQENNAANTANANTPGFKFQELVQRSMEEQQVFNHAGGPRNNQRELLGTMNFGTEIDGSYTSFTQGPLFETRIATDVALQGNGFFAVEMDNGQLGLTRNGNFRLLSSGQLVTQEGHPVLGRNTRGETVPVIVENGEFILDAAGHLLGSDLRLFLVDFSDYGTLEIRGGTLYDPGAQPLLEAETAVMQGYLEQSNVNLLDQVVKMMEVSREFEANQRTLRVMNDTLQKTVNEIGRN